MCTNSVSIAPCRTRSPGRTCTRSISPSLCSRDLALMSASESGVPTIGVPGNSRRKYGNAADVIFVAVRHEHRAQFGGALADVGEIVDDDVDAEHLVVGKHQAAVDDDQVVVRLDDGHIAADFAAAAERDDADVRRRRRRRND